MKHKKYAVIIGSTQEDFLNKEENLSECITSMKTLENNFENISKDINEISGVKVINKHCKFLISEYDFGEFDYDFNYDLDIIVDVDIINTDELPNLLTNIFTKYDKYSDVIYLERIIK